MSNSKNAFFGQRSLRSAGLVEPVHIDRPPKSPVTEFKFDSTESFIFDSIAQEVGKHVGTEVEWYGQDVEGSVRDPLYGEPIDRKWKGPFIIAGKVEIPDLSPEVKAEGLKLSFETTVWIARAEFEVSGLSRPKLGDVFHVWKIPFYGQQAEEQGYYFDVVDIDHDGHIYDTEHFVQFKIIGKRNTEFTAERRVES
jgi:hypothetical protein